MTRPIAVVVADTTPIITLAGTGVIHLLPLLFTEVHIPEQVWAEYEKFRAQFALPDLSQASWLHRHTVTIATRFAASLDDGEAAAITLALMLGAQLILMDEQKGRKAAMAAQVPLVGTLGLLLRAKQDGHLSAIKPVTDEFARLKRYYRPELIAQTLRAAGESE